MDVALFVSSLLLSLFRVVLNAFDPYLSRINVHLVEKPPSSVEKLLATIRLGAAKSGSLPSLVQNPQWRERLQLALDYVRTAEELTPFGRFTLYRYLRMEINALQCFEAIARKFPRVATVADLTYRPIFIMGLTRSGTTLLHLLLALYPNVFCSTRLRAVAGGISPNDVDESSSLVDLRRSFERVRVRRRNVREERPSLFVRRSRDVTRRPGRMRLVAEQVFVLRNVSGRSR